MIEWSDPHPNVDVQESEYKRLLGYPGRHVLEGRSRELADWAKLWYAEHGKPWIYARQADNIGLASERLKVGDTEFSSKQLHDQFVTAQAHSTMLVVVSAGKQCEEKAHELWQEGKPDEYFFMETYGSAVVEHLITTTGGRICAWAEQNEMTVLPHYSPGYSGWDVSDQTKLWRLIQQGQAQNVPAELQVMDTGMLRPKKSLLAIFGITRHLDQVRSLRNLIPCENCSLSGCVYRRAAYKHFLPQIEDVRHLQSSTGNDSSSEMRNGSALNHHAQYSLNAKALRKWAQERLQLKALPDGSVEAHFRYEGTTCSNLGHPLEFDYHVKLGSSAQAHRILDATCFPAPGDTGYAYQCEYLNNAELLTSSIAKEKPLLGRPLNDVLSWERSYSPSGCNCDAERRAHKWGLVLEVIHYALTRTGKQTSRDGQATTVLK